VNSFFSKVCVLISLFVAPLAVSQESSSSELETLTLQLRWLPQAQFMGYYVAQTLGFYEKEGLAVTILPGGPGVEPSESLSSETSDVAVEWLSSALESRERGHQPVNVAQILQQSSLMIICKKGRGIRSTADLSHRTISVWSGSSALGLKRWLASLERRHGKETRTIDLVDQNGALTSWRDKATDCISATSYNEYWELLNAGLQLSDATIFRLDNATDRHLEDGLYVDGSRLDDKEFLNKITRFTRASLAGWAYSAAHPEEAVEILLQWFPHLDRSHQTRMAKEIVRLIDEANEPLGKLAVEAFDAQAVFLGYDTGVTNRNQSPTANAWSHTVWRMLDDHDHSPLSDEVLYRLEKVLASPAFYILDLLGTLAFGLAGFARASERRYDLWGALVLTALPAVGGGTLRDVIVGGERHPPFIFSDPNYLYIVATIVIVGTIWDRLGPTGRPLIDTNSTLFLAIDTVGLAAFSIIGAKVAILAQLDWFWIPMLAAVTCAGGGVIMDIVSGREPRTFRGVMYEEIAILGGLVLLAILYLAQFATNVELFIQVAIIQTFILVYVLRIVSVQMDWTAPKLGARLKD